MSETNDNLNAEMNTIQTQIDNVNATISSQQRVISLNESYSKKMSAYTRLVLAVVFALAIAVLLNMLKSKFAIIPGAVITISYIILFSACIVYAMFVTADVNSREKTDFDKLDLDPPSGISKNAQQTTPNTGSLNLLPGYCIGKDCCTSAMAWDNDNNKCLTSCPNAGYFINSDTRECNKCIAGKYSAANNMTTTCSDCAPGKYSEAGAETCTDCAAGTFSTAAGSSSCMACAVGTFSVDGASSCIASCPANTYGDVTTKACIACPAATPNSVAGSLAASACTA
jgi:hypothetical protein